MVRAGGFTLKELGMRDPSLSRIWHQQTIPVVYRPRSGDLLIKLPFAENNRQWLSSGRRSRPTWSAQYKCWELPRSAFNELVPRILYEFHSVYTIQPHRQTEVCAPACWDAQGFDCECSCLSVNHGLGQRGGRWYIVSESYAVRWGDRELRWSLLQEKSQNIVASKR